MPIVIYKDILLSLMLIIYLIPILFIYYHFNNNISISNIIHDEKCKSIILYSMVAFCLLVLLYEKERNDYYSAIIISLIIIGIFGVIFIEENQNWHYFFASIVFLSILIFMFYHLKLYKNNKILFILFILQIIFFFLILINIQKNIFFSEALYILNFALFYIYIHFLDKNTK